MVIFGSYIAEVCCSKAEEDCHAAAVSALGEIKT